MIYACVRAWRECPNLFLWNVGAWSVLAMLASGFVQMPVQPAMYYGFGSAIPTQQSFAEHFLDAVHSEAFQLAQVGYAICGFLLMLFAVARGVYRRLVVASTEAGPRPLC